MGEDQKSKAGQSKADHPAVSSGHIKTVVGLGDEDCSWGRACSIETPED